LLLQSVLTLQVLPVSHFGQADPPQSISDSLPLSVKSPQVGSAHFDLVQTPLRQSVPTTHAKVSLHFVEQLAPTLATPPQSTAVSVPFFTPSGHFGA
jgi:hypothetical protein